LPDPAHHTAGMVETLIHRSEEVYCTSPLDALVLAEMAVEIAEGISIVAYPYDHVVKVRGCALREKAYLLSYLGKLPEANKAAQLSDRYLQQIPVPPPEVARLDLVRSNIAREQQNYDEAVAFARRAAESFLWFGDRTGWLKAQDYDACARLSAGDYRQALDIWRAVEPYVREMTPEHRAARLHNMGRCATEGGEFDEAAQAYAGAAEVFAAVGNVVNGVKCRCSAGYSFLCAGKPAQAIPLLESARAEFETLGMEIDAALAALQLIEALMLAGTTAEVPAICRRLIERFTRAGIQGSAMTALAFLRETVASGHATPALVKHVHGFIQIVRMEPRGEL
jgi:tetratricopeptide (TPR) repeat protein